jgi:anti-sigma factor RsiW
MSGQSNTEMVCRELVELVTEYLEGSLPSGQRLRFEQHIAYCAPCVRYLEQMRQTIVITGALREDDLDPEAREAMLHIFREFKA